MRLSKVAFSMLKWTRGKSGRSYGVRTNPNMVNLRLTKTKEKNMALNNKSAPQCSSFHNKLMWKRHILENKTLTLNRFNQPLSRFVDITEKMYLEQILSTPSISAHLPETFVLLWFKLFENLVFRAQSQRGQNPRFPDAAGAVAGRSLKSRSRPLPMCPGMKYWYFRKGNPRC